MDFDGQHDDETVEDFFRIHPVVMRKELIVLLLCICIGSLFFLLPYEYYNLSWIAFTISALVGGIIFGVAYFRWHFTYVILTNKRIINISQKGFFHKEFVEVGLDKVQNVNLTIDGLQQTIFHFGTIVVQTFAGDLVIENIMNPQQSHEKITHLIQKIVK